MRIALVDEFEAGDSFQVTIEARAANSQYLGGADLIAVAHFEDSIDVDALDILQGQWLPVVGRRRGAGRAGLDLFREIFQVNEIASGGNGGRGNGIFELPNVPWPGIPL